MSKSVFDGLHPEILWKHFEVFTKTPRPSGKEEAIAAYCEGWARERGYQVDKDSVGNLVVRVPASPGREKADTVIIQGHLDMVCERNSDSPYDAEKDPLHVVLDGEWLTAEGTTLGADNAIGVCAGMAAAEDESVQHGPLELLMTLDEETGMTGAMELDGSLLKGRTMLNLDSEDDGVLFVGCAGGCDTRFRMTYEKAPAPAGHKALRVALTGLKGGHSGLDIVRNHMNAIHALARVLQTGAGEIPHALARFDGGSKRNAIPREAFATVYVEAANESRFREGLEEAAEALRRQWVGNDDGLTVTVTDDDDAPAEVFASGEGMRLIRFLRGLPSGVIAMSQDIEGLVETSTNLGVVTTTSDAVEVISCTRSSVAEALRGALDQLQAVAALAGVEANEHGGYPGWKPNMQSRALQVTREASKRLTGQDPEVTAIHAGLECGLLGERVPGLDMISFGPDIRGAHSPDERIHVGSVGNFWKLLVMVLDDLSK